MFNTGIPGLNVGVPELIVLALAALFVIAVLSRRSRRDGRIRIPGPALVLRKFNVDELARNGLVVDIEGRASGLLSWLLTVIGLDATTSLKVTVEQVFFDQSSLFGQVHRVVPLPSVSSTLCGYSRRIGYLVLGVLLCIAGIVAGSVQQYGIDGVPGWPFIVVGLLFIIAYFLSKRLAIAVETCGGDLIWVKFKRSIIENVAMDMEKAVMTIQLINRKIVEAQLSAAAAKKGRENGKSSTFAKAVPAR